MREKQMRSQKITVKKEEKGKCCKSKGKKCCSHRVVNCPLCIAPVIPEGFNFTPYEFGTSCWDKYRNN